MYRTAPLATKGMPPGISYIIGNEFAERFSFYGMRAILMVFSLEFAVTRTIDAARRLFLGSILYLPILWGLLVWDHVAH